MRGDRLKTLREMRGFTQSELAEMANVEILQIYRYESGRNKPASDIVARLAAALGCSSDYLLGLSDEMTGYLGDQLSENEKAIIDHLRHGDPLAAIKSIVGNQ